MALGTGALSLLLFLYSALLFFRSSTGRRERTAVMVQDVKMVVAEDAPAAPVAPAAPAAPVAPRPSSSRGGRLPSSKAQAAKLSANREAIRRRKEEAEEKEEKEEKEEEQSRTGAMAGAGMAAKRQARSAAS